MGICHTLRCDYLSCQCPNQRITDYLGSPVLHPDPFFIEIRSQHFLCSLNLWTWTLIPSPIVKTPLSRLLNRFLNQLGRHLLPW